MRHVALGAESLTCLTYRNGVSKYYLMSYGYQLITTDVSHKELVMAKVLSAS